MVIKKKNEQIEKKQTKRIAVIISNGTFDDLSMSNLVGPKIDNEKLSKVLGDPDIGGFDIVSLVDHGLLQVRKAIAAACATANEEDTLLIYYSGRSYTSEDGNFCLPVADTDSRFLSATTLESEFILTQLRNTKCKRIVLLIDGCRSGAFFENNRGVPDGMVAITSCGSSESCTDTPEGGTFTLALIDGLTNLKADRDNDGKVSVDELYEYVKDFISKNNYDFHPQKWVWNLPEPIFIANVPKLVFISYSREDIKFVEQLSQELEKNDIKTWMDKTGIYTGQNFPEKIASTIDSARCLLFVISENSLKSKWGRRELEFADEKGIPLIPVVYKQCEIPSWFNLQFGRIQSYQINYDNFKNDISELVDSIRKTKKSKNI